jgi:hypothetical protein
MLDFLPSGQQAPARSNVRGLLGVISNVSAARNDVRFAPDIVAKVENRTTSKISQKLIFGRRGHCNTP